MIFFYFYCLGCFQGTFPMKLPLRQDASQITTPAFRDGFGTYRYIFFSLQSHQVSQFYHRSPSFPHFHVCFPEKMTTLMMWPPWLEWIWGRRMRKYWPAWWALWFSRAMINSFSLQTCCSAKSFMQVQMMPFQENCILVARPFAVAALESSSMTWLVQLMWAVPLIGLELDGHVALWLRSHDETCLLLCVVFNHPSLLKLLSQRFSTINRLVTVVYQFMYLIGCVVVSHIDVSAVVCVLS